MHEGVRAVLWSLTEVRRESFEYRTQLPRIVALGRIYCTGTPEDYKAVHALQNRISVVPLLLMSPIASKAGAWPVRDARVAAGVRHSGHRDSAGTCVAMRQPARPATHERPCQGCGARSP